MKLTNEKRDQIKAAMCSDENMAADPPEKFARWAVVHARALFSELEKSE